MGARVSVDLPTVAIPRRDEYDLLAHVDRFVQFALTLIQKVTAMSHEPKLLPPPCDKEDRAFGGADTADSSTNDSASGSEGAGTTDGPRAKDSGARSDDRYLDMLAALPQLLLIGAISVPTANAIRGICDSILRHSTSRRSANASGTPDLAALAALLGKDPSLSKLIEPFLTAEQIDALLRGTNH
jgi:hypothetical protein